MRTINEIKRIEIKGLFGFLNYDIELSGKGIDIITGPNGSGKTTILRLVIAVLEQDLEGLAWPRYDSITIHAGTEPYEVQSPDSAGQGQSTIFLTNIKIHVANRRGDIQITIDDIEVGYVIKRKRTSSSDGITGELEETFHLDPTANLLQRLGIFYKAQDVTLLNLPRLTQSGMQASETPSKTDIEFDITVINQLLRSSIGRASQVLLDTLARSSQVLVDSLVTERITRIRSSWENVPLNDLTIFALSDEYERLKTQFQIVGINLDTSVLDSFFRRFPYGSKFSAERNRSEPDSKRTVSVAELYARTMVAGYREAAVHTDRIYQLLTRLNSALSEHKHASVFVSDNGDARVRITLTNPTTGDSVEITKGLSSGEQRYIKLFAELVLSNPTTVYVIDEPELSLHPEWLDRLLVDLEAVRGRSQYIIASHSPLLVVRCKDRHIDLPITRKSK